VRGRSLILTCMLIVCGLATAPSALADGPGTGGLAYTEPAPVAPGVAAPADPAQATVPGAVAQIGPNGLAAAPEAAPQPVKQAIWAANRIIGLPYRYGGGHGRGFVDRGYDCSGTVSFALNGGDLLDTPLDSGSFMRWGDAGAGTWITVYANGGHAYAVIAGLRLDTSAVNDRSGAKGPRWRALPRSPKGFRARHPAGF
jgi:hypothetical protein